MRHQMHQINNINAHSYIFLIPLLFYRKIIIHIALYRPKIFCHKNYNRSINFVNYMNNIFLTQILEILASRKWLILYVEMPKIILWL
jgi:hypothetical protein